MTDRISLRRPDDWHLHLRDGAMLRAVLPYTAAQFARGIIMTNLVPPIATGSWKPCPMARRCSRR